MRQSLFIALFSTGVALANACGSGDSTKTELKRGGDAGAPGSGGEAGASPSGDAGAGNDGEAGAASNGGAAGAPSSGGTTSAGGSSGGNGSGGSASGGSSSGGSSSGGSAGTGPGNALTIACDWSNYCEQITAPPENAYAFEENCLDLELTPGDACPTAGVSGVCTITGDAAGGEDNTLKYFYYGLDSNELADAEAECNDWPGSTWSLTP